MASYCAHQVFVVIVGCLAYALVYFYRYAPSVLYEYLAEGLGVPEDRISIFGSMYFWTYAVMQPIGGVMSDLMSPRLLIALSTLTSSIGSAIIAASTNFQLSCFARLIIGIGCGPVFVPVNRMLANWFSPRAYGIVGSVIFSAGSAGGMLAQGPLLSLAELVQWRWTFVMASAFGVVLSFVGGFFMRDTPEEAGFHKEVKMRDDFKSSVVEDEDGRFAGHMRKLGANLRLVLGKRNFWFLAIWDFLSPSTFQNLSSMWAGPYLRDVVKLDSGIASYSLMMLPLSWVIGAPILVGLSDCLKTRKWMIVVCCAVGLATCAGFIFVTEKTNYVLVLCMLFVYALGSSAVLAVGNAMFKEMNSAAVATSMGCANFFPFIATAILQTVSPLMLNLAEKEQPETGHSLRAYRLGLWVPTLIMLSGALLSSIFTTETYPKKVVDDTETIVDDEPLIGSYE